MKSMVIPKIINAHDVCVVILAGGQSRRFGGKQKALQLFLEKPLIFWVKQALSEQVNQVYVNANAEKERYQSWCENLFSDMKSESLGPLSGMASAFQKMDSEWILFVPCDNPFLPKNLLKKLITAYQQEQKFVIVAHDGYRMQPLYCLIHQSKAQDLLNAVENGQLSVKRWLQDQNPALADFSEEAEQAFPNLNSLADLQELEQKVQAENVSK